jgi:hypothetical protein
MNSDVAIHGTECQEPPTHANKVPVTLVFVFENRLPLALGGVVDPAQDALAIDELSDPTPQVGVLGLVLNREYPPLRDFPSAYIPTNTSVENGRVVPVTSSLMVLFCALVTPMMVTLLTVFAVAGHGEDEPEPQR